ncbi:MAG: hypothetical protein ACLFR1_01255 [Spirochaetia bacterium]
MMRIILSKGLPPNAGFIFAAYGAMVCAYRDDTETAYRFGKLGIACARMQKHSPYYSTVCSLYGSIIGHWREHIRHKDYSIEGYESGVENGEFEHYSRVLKDTLKQEMTYYRNEMFHQIAANLMSDSDTPYLLLV